MTRFFVWPRTAAALVMKSPRDARLIQAVVHVLLIAFAQKKKKNLVETIGAIQKALFWAYTLQPLPALSSCADEQGCTWWLMLRCSLKPAAHFKMCTWAAPLSGCDLIGSNAPDTPNMLKSTLPGNRISNGLRTGTVPQTLSNNL